MYDSEGEKTGYEDTSDADGQVTIENIPLRNIHNERKDASVGYIQSTDTWVVEVTKDKVLLYLQGDEVKLQYLLSKTLLNTRQWKTL